MVPILVPLLISSFRRADELANAMDSRCYRGAKGRTKMKISKMKFGDFLRFCYGGNFILRACFGV